ncbi:hypothetical protein Pmani_020119 [Petrolisthes manimaculis]|uniref:Uncharacterized protein n=1 Tax=Petrolisthes manimaculis TaxID=1843537 RepID=A0AAE1PJ34_9EUCA|nr:hypothetical protein Pmani_020119 [Petrolisthes manimaculis]
MERWRVERWRGGSGEMGMKREVRMERWRGGEWRGGNEKRGENGKVERWRDGEVESAKAVSNATRPDEGDLYNAFNLYLWPHPVDNTSINLSSMLTLHRAW